MPPALKAPKTSMAKTNNNKIADKIYTTYTAEDYNVVGYSCRLLNILFAFLLGFGKEGIYTLSKLLSFTMVMVKIEHLKLTRQCLRWRF